jgi:hypothetical protein
MLFLVENSLVRKKCETVRSHNVTASSFVAKIRDEVFAHFCAVRGKTSQHNEELTVWPEFVINPFHNEDNCEYSLDFALHLSRFFFPGEFGPSVDGSCFLPRTLV